MKSVVKFVLAAAAVMFLVGTAQADVILGQSCALSGPTSFLGTEMNRGAKAYFDTYAKDVKLKALDDKYEPNLCVKNTNQFIQEKVTALFGYVGTPTSKMAVPISTQNKTVFMGAFTGAGFLSDPNRNPYSFSVRASYDAELESMVRHLKEDLGVKKIGLFVQKDAFGLVGIKGVAKAVKKIGGVEIKPAIPKIPSGSAPKSEWDQFWKGVPSYKRNTIAIGKDVRRIMAKRVEAVIMVGAYRPCAAAIKEWKKKKLDAVFINISFVGSRALAKALKDDVDNVYITQVVPNPWDSNIPVVREYQQAVGAGNYGFVSLEGYISAKIMHKAILDAKPDVNSNTLKNRLEALTSYDLGGIMAKFGPSDHRGLDAVYLTGVEASIGADGEYDYKFNYIDKLVKK